MDKMAAVIEQLTGVPLAEQGGGGTAGVAP